MLAVLLGLGGPLALALRRRVAALCDDRRRLSATQVERAVAEVHRGVAAASPRIAFVQVEVRVQERLGGEQRPLRDDEDVLRGLALACDELERPVLQFSLELEAERLGVARSLAQLPRRHADDARAPGEALHGRLQARHEGRVREGHDAAGVRGVVGRVARWPRLGAVDVVAEEVRAAPASPGQETAPRRAAATSATAWSRESPGQSSMYSGLMVFARVSRSISSA